MQGLEHKTMGLWLPGRWQIRETTKSPELNRHVFYTNYQSHSSGFAQDGLSAHCGAPKRNNSRCKFDKE